jgi:exodeoxyribonuclease VII large subunit
MSVHDEVTRSADSSSLSWSVSGLLLALTDALAARFGSLTVHGELSGWSRAASGHAYFTVKDADGAAASLRCVLFRRAATLLDFAPADGQRVEVRGRLAVYEPRGDLQFVVESMRRQGAGTLYEQFLRLRARLEAAGLFDPSRRRSLPPHPRALGVITSTGAAALRDVVTALRRRSPHVPVVIYPCLVQGAEAPASIVRAMQQAAARAEVDVLLLVRGGGSLEDLWAFNDERVVRAIAASPIPVVCGVGHETDVTLSDLAADLRAPTPTAAAELAAPLRDELLHRLAAVQARMSQGAQRALDRQSQRLDLLARRAGQPGGRLAAQTERIAALGQRLGRAVGTRALLEGQRQSSRQHALARAASRSLSTREDRLNALGMRLQSVHPQHVLRRGYAWVTDETGRPVPGIEALCAGMTVYAVMHDGRARASITGTEMDAQVASPDGLRA